MRSASLPGLEEARDHHISTVLATAWGDNGAECPLPAILYGLQLYAEFTYTGDTSPSALASRFESCVGEPCEAFPVWASSICLPCLPLCPTTP